MKIAKYINEILDGLSDFDPDCIRDVIHFVKSYYSINSISLLLVNSKKSSLYLSDQCYALFMNEEDPDADIKLAGLLVITAESYDSFYDDLIALIAFSDSDFHWSRVMALSYLIRQEVESERIRKSA